MLIDQESRLSALQICLAYILSSLSASSFSKAPAFKQLVPNPQYKDKETGKPFIIKANIRYFLFTLQPFLTYIQNKAIIQASTFCFQANANASFLSIITFLSANFNNPIRKNLIYDLINYYQVISYLIPADNRFLVQHALVQVFLEKVRDIIEEVFSN